MRVIAQNTEQHLIQDLRALWHSAPSFRCVHLRFSSLETKKEEWFPVVLDTLKTYFTEDTETLYVCHDNDVFITTKTFTEKQVSLFLTHLKQKLSPASLQGLAAIFELKVDWPKLRDLCENKIENLTILRNKLKQKKKESLGNISRKDTLEKLNVDLISSLGMRRDMREKPVIMVVEDDIFTQKLVKNTLKDYENVSVTGDGQGAIMTYVNKAPDVLFLDIGLPDIDGLSVLEKLFRLDPAAYVVMFSGNGDKENVMKAIKLGAKGFIAKPFTKDQVFQYIEKSPFIQSKQKQGVA